MTQQNFHFDSSNAQAATDRQIKGKWYTAITTSSNVQGKRKKSAKRPSGKKKLEPLPTQFSCLFCNHDDSVVCKLDKVHRIGNLICKVCGQGHQCVINSKHVRYITDVDLSAPIDVYSDWIDAAEAVGRGNATTAGGEADDYEQE
jgi:transcription elongation factor Elf1